MPPRALHGRPGPPIVIAAVLAALIAGCTAPPSPRTTFTWLVGQSEPPFDPAGPADPVRWSLERLLGEGLVAEDTTGRIVQAAAWRWEVTSDALTYTFHLRPGLRFLDGAPCGSEDFRHAIESGLNRVDHSAYAWLLSPIVGVDRVRAGRALPALGIATPDDHTLVLRLVRADPTLLHKLALPGASMPWRRNAGHGGWDGGIGPYHVVSREPGRRMLLARRDPTHGPDTVRVEFSPSASRTRGVLRKGRATLLWPLPPGLLAQGLPEGFRVSARAARPARRLWLILRHDLPPTRKPEARRALAHGLNRPVFLSTLGARGEEPGPWLPGAGPVDLPRRDAGAVREWLARGRLGRSMHVVMAYSSEGVAAEVARGMQAQWADVALDIELRPLRRAALAAEVLRRGGAQMLLIEVQPPAADPVAELAMLIEPAGRPPIGSFRTGWTTREFDRWVGPQPAETPLDLELARARLENELGAIPLARLPWTWVESVAGQTVGFHPRFGPGINDFAPGSQGAHR